MYKRDEKEIYNIISENTKINEIKSLKEFDTFIKCAIKFFNAQIRLGTHLYWSLSWQTFSGHKDYESAIFSAFHKNIFLFYSIIDLTNKGLYGSARSLMRSIFEALLIGKYCAISKDMSLFRKWEKGEYINITNAILNKLKSPDPTEMKYFWKSLNEVTHASVFAQQIDIEYKNIKDNISFNYTIILMLLDLNYHLINRHWLTDKLIYYIKKYSTDDNFLDARSRVRELSKVIKSTLEGNSKKLVLDYERKWILKEI